jgi:microcystin-dependent protein
MSTPLLGEIRMAGFNFAPRGWALCNGQIMAISQNSALFALLGTTFGGNGQTTFALPNLQGRFPMHWGNGPGLTPRVIGETAGGESVTLVANNVPAHTHPFSTTAAQGCSDGPGGFDNPGTHVPAISANAENYAAGPGTATMAPFTVAGNTGPSAGGGQPVPILSPYQCVTFIIALEGIFPSRS